ncbi:MAG: fluoride efflux transporter CrcB [Candidatus Omnitrophica bacterium]|nr:fluoride efflux transporter CrcB [Candidatus Omnitrophota bacterium]MDD5437286.1 fluoride efflux transporter CrcB [Candidatus Omnitrophota bacterium]
MARYLLILAGGAIGTLFRYIVSGLDYKVSNGIFPISTLVVNLAGSLVIGLLWGLFEHVNIHSNMRMFIFIGILGGFTTFSSFSLENFNLFRDGEVKIALTNIFLTNFFGIAMVFIGFAISRYLINVLK